MPSKKIVSLFMATTLCTQVGVCSALPNGNERGIVAEENS